MKSIDVGRDQVSWPADTSSTSASAPARTTARTSAVRPSASASSRSSPARSARLRARRAFEYLLDSGEFNYKRSAWHGAGAISHGISRLANYDPMFPASSSTAAG